MLTVYPPGANRKFLACLDFIPLSEASYANSLNYSTSVSVCPLKSSCNTIIHNPSSFKRCTQLNTHCVLNRSSFRRCLCRSDSSPPPSDDEYRSSRNIAISLFRRYRNFVDRGGGDNLKDFISAGVNAYALGCTDEGLRKELIDMKEAGLEIEVMQSYGGSTGLKSKIISGEIEECILWLSIIFITILCTPQPTVVRWSSTPPVSDEIRLQWKGFCALIANAYYVRGMAWLPVKTLQLEQMAVVGRAEEPSVVASRMRIVFSTLELVHNGLKYNATCPEILLPENLPSYPDDYTCKILY
ncbi:uncharacterized protein E5676_scaffold255G006360 [Cucumis melo var. makuwa]|uniref:DUF7876 domain-containing protein n=1 Tax=Cucumis melo var. makuwa TaxID=1194695 RepID=A0A5D3CPS7_CUCMM|nr:uncharacterized protein E5676_scaffold255G006360 [Cucumis melo var. makuwa]